MSAGVVATQMAIMFLFLFIGYGLTKRGHFSADTSRDLSFIIANICCPSMLLAGIFTAPAMTGRELLEGGIATVVIYGILILLGLLVGPLLGIPKAERKFYQLMTIFSNVGFIGYPVVNAVIGPEGMAFAALFNLGFNLLIFTYGIVLLRQGQASVNWKTFLNAGTLSGVLAIVLLLTKLTVPTPVVSCLSYMGNAMTFFASAIIGHSLAGTSFKKVLENKKTYGFIVLRYLLVPILLGLALLIQPTAAQWWTSTRNAKTAAQFAARAEAQPTAPAAEETTAEPPEPERAYPELYAAMQDYNAEIYAGGQSGLTDPFAYEEAPLDLAAYGYDDDVLAVLWIPRLNLELPVYLGASRENLAKGAALLGQTSMPLGGENTNTVIAAHRGYYGAEMLRNVQQIQVGDKIQLTTPWETLIYRVSELKIIDPSDINAVLIQPGRDLLTLSTCHPYTRNSQRYLVIAEHDTAAADTTKEEDLQESAATWDETPRQVTVEDASGSSIAEVAPQALTPLPGEGSAESEGSAISNTMIWLENNALWAGLVVIAAAVGIMVIWKKHRED